MPPSSYKEPRVEASEAPLPSPVGVRHYRETDSGSSASLHLQMQRPGSRRRRRGARFFLPLSGRPVVVSALFSLGGSPAQEADGPSGDGVSVAVGEI